MKFFKFGYRVLKSWLITGCVLTASGISAQTTPNIGDALRQAQPPVLPAEPKSELPPIGGLPMIAPPMTALPATPTQGSHTPTVQVQAIEVVGNLVIDAVSLQAIVKDGVGKSLTLMQLEELAQRITKHYRSSGYFVARAYIPAQDVSNGRVKIQVVEGNYGQFILNNQSLVSDAVVQGLLDDVKGYDIVSLDTLERVMLIINDTPGIKVTRADVLPGDKVGTSDFAVDAVATRPYTGYVMVDNYGSVYTGKNRVSFNADFNSPTGRGDRLSVSGLGTDTGNLLNGRVGYSRLLMPNGLRGEVGYSQTQYQLGDVYSTLDARGTAKGLDATLTYPVRRIRAQTVEASLNVAHKELEDKIQSTQITTPKTSSTLTASMLVQDERVLFGLDGLTQGSLSLTLGDLAIKDTAALSNDTAGANTHGNFKKIMASISRLSSLPAGYSLTTALRLQQALGNKNLDGSEKLAVSGSAGVMAYPSGELIGSNATFLHLELNHPVTLIDSLRTSYGVFTNYGQAHESHPLTPTETRHISDVGLSLSGSYQQMLFKVNWAHRQASTGATSEPYPRNKLLLQIGWMF